MKKTANKPVSNAMTRRQFIGRTLAAGVISAAPAILRGQNLNNKLNIAFIACGGRAAASLGELTVVSGRGAGGGRDAGANLPGPHAGEGRHRAVEPLVAGGGVRGRAVGRVEQRGRPRRTPGDA